MAGHSKWKQIKHSKAAADAKRGALFTKLIREITVAARTGGGDPGANPRLRTAIDAAKQSSMPKDNIERAIKKGTGELDGVDYQEVTYEGYAPGGVALIIQTLTDNANRTVADLRFKLSRAGGNLGATNSVAWMFERKGVLVLAAAGVDEDAALEAALDAGAEDFRREDEQFVVITDPAQLHTVKGTLEAAGLAIGGSEIAMVPKTTVKVDAATGETLLKLLDELDELDDVQKVWSNFDMDDAAMAAHNG